MDNNPERLRARAVQLYAIATEVFGSNRDYGERLVAEAIEELDRAIAMEEAAQSSKSQPRVLSLR
jgi:hypothetical protein